MPVKRAVPVLALLSVLAGAFFAACSDREEALSSPTPVPSPTVTPTPLPAASELLAAIDDAIGVVEGYRLQVSASNVVLPQWGGIGGGTVTVGQNGTSAFAELYRTGDGGYAMILYRGQTYFRRDTCDSWTRVPGGGADVLSPFLFNANHAIRNATGSKVTAGKNNTLVVLATIEPFGRVELTVDARTLLPLRIFRDPASGQAKLELVFADYGQAPNFNPPPPGTPEGGPGGDPC